MAGATWLRTEWSLAFDDFAGLDAAGADPHTLTCAVHLSLDRLQVDVPAAPGRVVGVRNVIAELRTLAAEITFLCHDEILQSRIAETSGNQALGMRKPQNGAVEVVGTSGLEPLTSTVSR
jgi:hypothetical protein